MFALALLSFVSSSIQASDPSKWEAVMTDYPDLYFVRGDGSHKMLLAKGAEFLNWSTDGTRLAYAQNETVFVRDMQTGKTTRVFKPRNYEAGQVAFDPRTPILNIPHGNGFEIVGVNGSDFAFYRGRWRHGMVGAIDWSPSGNKLLFASDGDVWLGFRDPADHFDPEIGPWDYITAIRLAAVATFYDGGGNSASTPDWADCFSWFSDERHFLVQVARQHAGGSIKIGLVDLRPDGKKDNPEMGYEPHITWLFKKATFNPSVCPDGTSFTVTGSGKGGSGWGLQQYSMSGRFIRTALRTRNLMNWRPLKRPATKSKRAG